MTAAYQFRDINTKPRRALIERLPRSRKHVTDFWFVLGASLQLWIRQMDCGRFSMTTGSLIRVYQEPPRNSGPAQIRKRERADETLTCAFTMVAQKLVTGAT